MCRELSAVFTCFGNELKMYRSPDTDAHRDILELHNLSRGDERTACVEYVCTDYDRADEPDVWELQLDTEREPVWWQDHKHAIADRMDALREALTIRADRQIIVGGGPYILAKDVQADRMVRCRILTMCEGASAGNASTVIGGNRSTITGGDASTVIGGNRSTVTGGNWASVTGGYGAKLRLRDANDSIHEATVGENGIRPRHGYHFHDGEFVLD